MTDKELFFIAKKTNSALHWAERVATEVNPILSEELELVDHNRWYAINQHMLDAIKALEYAHSIQKKVIPAHIWEELE